MAQTAQRVFSGTPWEEAVGYCRALRVGNQVFVSGTSPSNPDGTTFAPNDAYGQTKRCFDLIAAALDPLGGTLAHVVRTRIYVTDIDCWDAIAQVHQELFGEHPPANTLVEVNRLINADMLVEIEVDAILPENAPPPAPALPRQSARQSPQQSPRQSPIYRQAYQRPISAPNYPPIGGGELDESCLD